MVDIKHKNLKKFIFFDYMIILICFFLVGFNVNAAERECLASKGCLGTCTYSVDGNFDYEDPDFYARITLKVTYNVYNTQMRLSNISESAGTGQTLIKDKENGDAPLETGTITYNKFPSTYSSYKNSCPEMFFGFSDDFSKIAVDGDINAAKNKANKKGSYSLAVPMNGSFNAGTVSSNLNEKEECSINLYQKDKEGKLKKDENGKLTSETRDVLITRNDSDNTVISVHINTVHGITCSTSPGGNCSNIASKFLNSSSLMIECPTDLVLIKDQHGAVTPATKAQIEAYENSGVDVTTSDEAYDRDDEDKYQEGPELPFINIDTSELNCDALAPILDDIQMVYDYAKILVVVLLILFCSIDFSKAVMSQDNDLLKKATNSAIKRGIAAILFLFLPTLINLIFPYAGPEFENPLCGIQWVVMFNV